MANPHDRFFKSTFSQAENAMGEFQAVLPPYLIVPTFEFVLDDLTKLSEAQLFGRAMTAAASFSLFCLKRAFYSGDFRKEIELATGAFRRVANAQNPIAALETILRYIMEVSEVPTDWLREFTSREVGREAEEAYMTAAEQLRREGIQEGLQKGRAEGRVEGRAKVVLKLLTLRFGSLSKEHTQRVKEASVEALDRFAERVLNANNISDVFDL